MEYRAHHSHSSPADLTNLYEKSSVDPPCEMVTVTRSFRYWCGPYLESQFVNDRTLIEDEWGTPLSLLASQLRSCGENKTCGDADDISISIL